MGELNPLSTRETLRHDRQAMRAEEERLQQALVKLLARRSSSNTTQLEQEAKDRLPLTSSFPYGAASELEECAALRLPKDARANAPRWLISLNSLTPRSGPILLEIAGDVVLGIERPGQPAPDLDLQAYDAEDKGVSRRHAVLRPSRNRLYLIDLQSTNGTRVNALPVGAGIAREVCHNDTISLGALTFSIKIHASATDLDMAQFLTAPQQVIVTP